MESLEEKFWDTQREVKKEISAHLKAAQEEIKKAEKLAEKHGIPFVSCVSPFAERVYIPETFTSVWPDLDHHQVLDDMDIYVQDLEPGWEYWSSSSLTC